LAIGAAIALTSSVGAAHGATIVSYAGYGTALDRGETLVTDFRDPTALPAGFTLGGTAAFLTGTSSVGAAPAIGAASRDPNQYLCVEANEFETLATPALKNISIYIGSLDVYNTLIFSFENGSKQVFTGVQLANIAHSVANGDQQSSATNGRYTFIFDAPINEIRFSSGGYSLEVADVAAVIPGGVARGAAAPEPSTWAMMLLGLGALGATRRRRRPAASPAPPPQANASSKASSIARQLRLSVRSSYLMPGRPKALASGLVNECSAPP